MVVGDNFVFVHCPKTGGTSISEALGGRTPGDIVSLHRPLHSFEAKGRKAFGFVRNPWDWQVSIYHYNNDDPRPEGFRTWLLKGKTYLGDDYMTRRIQPIQKRSQMYWLAGCKRIGQFEKLSADFKKICDEFRIVAAPLPHLNGSEPRELRKFYDTETVAFVAQHSAMEIARFRYTYGGR